MNRDSIFNARRSRLIRPPGRAGASSAPARLPSWWLAGSDEYQPIHAARSEIHDHDSTMAKNALVIMMGAVLTAVLVYSVDAVGAPGGPAGSGAMLGVTVALLVLTGLWILDRRLAQQYRDAKLQALVWTDLVVAVRHGWIDLAMIEAGLPFENTVEALLRRELRVVVQFLAAREGLDLHLPVFDEDITLVKA